MDNDPEGKPEPRPEPEAAPQGAPQADPAARGAGFVPKRGPGEAYTARPDFPERRRRWWPLALALAVALGGVGIGFRARAPQAPAPVAVAQTAEVLLYSQKDFDAATTASARAALERDKSTHELEALASRERSARAAPVPAAPRDAPLPAPIPAPAAAEQALQELAVAPQALRDDVSAGRAGFYTFHLAELVDEGGDVYDISVDGAPLLRVTTSPELKTITIPMDTSRPHTVTQTLVFARPRGFYAQGPGGGAAPPVLPQNRVSFAVRTSAGEARSHVSSAGESQTWSAQFLGNP